MAASTPAWSSLQNFVANHSDTYPAILPTSGPSLSGKSVLITGASKGIGRTTAIRYALAGCTKIAIAARSPLEHVVTDVQAAFAGAGHAVEQLKVLPLTIDISSEESIAAAAEEVKTAFGGTLDILIANAATVEDKWTPLLDISPAEWWRVWEVNVRGTFLTMQHFLPLVLASSSKTLIVVSSMGAFIRPPGASAYELGKLALIGLVEYAMLEYGQKGLVAVALGPGGVMTDMGMSVPDEYHAMLTDTPELAADTMVWLGRDRKLWLSGRYVDAKWDMSELESRKEEIEEMDLLKVRAAV